MYTRLPKSPALEAVIAYSNKFNEELLNAAPEEGNYISSPLGAWLLLALISNHNADTNLDRSTIEKYLGLPTEEAYHLATELLTSNPEPITAVAGAWIDPTVLQELKTLHHWIEKAKTNVTVEDHIPTQEVLNKWTADNTKDLIKEFPANVSSDTVFILATALATKISWREKFNVVPNKDLPNWDITNVLESVSGHEQWLTEQPEGIFAVHAARSADNLAVYSIIGPEELDPATVTQVAQRILTTDKSHLSLFDIPLDVNASHFSIKEETLEILDDSNRERYISYLPAWGADSKHELTKLFGFPEAARNFTENKSGYIPEIVQVAVASYDRDGFEAAAVTSFMVGRSAMPRLVTVPVRTATLTFNHPYAVIAVYEDFKSYKEDNIPTTAIWNGVPVFTAWVKEVKDSELREEN